MMLKRILNEDLCEEAKMGSRKNIISIFFFNL